MLCRFVALIECLYVVWGVLGIGLSSCGLCGLGGLHAGWLVGFGFCLPDGVFFFIKIYMLSGFMW